MFKRQSISLWKDSLIHSISVLIVPMFGLFISAANAEIYRYIDESGRVVYSSSRPPSAETVRTVDIRDNAVSSMESYEERDSKEVVMYSASWCGVCKRARAYFDDQGIYYTEYDVENDPQGRQDYARLGRRGVPIILIGERRMDGFSKSRFQQLYTADN